MNKALKVTFGAVIALGMVGTAQAYPYDDIGSRSALLVTGNYTKLSNNGLEYGPLNLSAPNAPSIFKDSIMNPDWSWDLGLGLTYRFCNSDTRVFAYWDHYRNDDSQTATPIYRYPLGNTTSVANVNYGSDELRLGVSQSFSFQDLASVDVGAFFEWVKLTRDMDVYDSTGNYANIYNKMDGYGPGIAMMARVYPFTNFDFLHAFHGIGGFLGTTTSLLYAHNDFSHAFVGTGAGSYSRISSSESIVGKLDISFGLDYCSSFSHNTIFGLSLGMRYLNIFNAFKNANQGPSISPSTIDITGNAGADDWGRIGPFIQFRIGGKDA